MRFNINNNKSLPDIELVGNPQITYFKSVYRRHTQFVIRKYTISCDSGNRGNRIPHLGDLVSTVKLEMDVKGSSGTIINNIGTSLLNNISLYVNEKEIDNLSGSYIEMYLKLNNPTGINNFYQENGTELTANTGTMEQILSLAGGMYNMNNLSNSSYKVIIPIPFSFTTNPGNSLPLFLFHNNRPLYIYFNLNNNDLSINTNFIVDYIILSYEEKMRFKVSTNEYLYHRIYEQKVNINKTVSEFDIDNYGNILSIMWYNDISKNYKYNIKINNSDLLLNNMTYHYFSKHIIRKLGYVGSGNTNASYGNASMVVNNDSICIYPFSLVDYINNNDETISPSGSISSNKNNIVFVVENNIQDFDINIDLILYIKSYNVLNIKEGYIYLEYVH